MNFRILRAMAPFAVAAAAWAAPDVSQEFTQSIRPVLEQNCSACHSPNKPKNPANFLKDTSVKDVDANRALWRNVATQLRNRTMPPFASKLAEGDRLKVAAWIEGELRSTSCMVGEYAGAGTIRRLNRREYRNTLRDLLGIDYDVNAEFPADGTGGAGFDTNGETLYVPPMLMERYVEAAQQILDRVIYTPPLLKTFATADLTGHADHLAPGEKTSFALSVYMDGDYEMRLVLPHGTAAQKLAVQLDGADAGEISIGHRIGKDAYRPFFGRLEIHLGRGLHALSLSPVDAPAGITSIAITEKREAPTAEQRAFHYHLLGLEPGEEPRDQRRAARQLLATFLPKAFRRPVTAAEVDRFMTMYDRAAERGDPYEERIKLTLKTVLVWPDFLFRMETRHDKPGIYPVGQYEMATRLSYFLWSTTPDEQLLALAAQNRLQDPKVLTEQVDRMLDDPRSRAFTNTFIGEWLGTQDIGGRVVPLLTEISSYYTPDVAKDLRTQPVLMFDRMLAENRSVADLLDADYTYLTKRLVHFYQMEGKVEGVTDNEFHLVKWPDNKRAGVLGLAGVLAMTSRYEQTSPVLRGAWALDTLLGTPVPPPPPNVPALKTGADVKKVSMRERLMAHRANPACAACHKMMDPIGFGLENFDWMGRWRDNDADGKPVNATGELPSGEKFNGPVELRNALLTHKEDFIRHVSEKVLGYALGRSLQDGDACTVQRIVQKLAANNYGTRTMIEQIVLSVPFRNTQGGAVAAQPPITQTTRLNISKLTAVDQDADAHQDLKHKH
jgi:cytochrome c553